MKQQLGEASLLAGATPLAQVGPSHMDIKLDDKGGNFDISYLTHLDSLKLSPPGLPAQEQDNIDLDFSYNNLNKQALLAWQADTMALANRADLRNNPAAMQQASMALVYKHMGAFLAQSPPSICNACRCTCPKAIFREASPSASMAAASRLPTSPCPGWPHKASSAAP
jgi:hypothetical protein